MNLFDVPASGIHRDTPKDGEFRFRIGEFIEPGKDHWWWLAPDIYAERLAELSVSKEFKKGFDGLSEMPIEEALSNVSPCVNEAIDIIKECAIPYFREVESEYENKE